MATVAVNLINKNSVKEGLKFHAFIRDCQQSAVATINDNETDCTTYVFDDVSCAVLINNKVFAFNNYSEVTL